MGIYKNMKTINIGLVGFGAMGKLHAFCVSSLPYYFERCGFEASLYGICTSSLEHSKDVLERYGFKKIYEDAHQMISDPCIDVIDICTPNYLHHEVILEALSAGKNVLCEKPLCVTVDEALEAYHASMRTGTVCGIVFNNRHLSPIIRAKQLIDEGRIGDIISFSGEYLHDSAIDTKKKAGWKQNSDYGGGVLYDLGSHIIDLIYYLCGEFESVFGRAQIAFPTRPGQNGEEWQTNADEAFYINARLKCGACGSITASKLATGTNDDLNFSIYGTKGAIKFSLMEPDWIYFYDTADKSDSFGGDRGFKRIECVQRYGISPAFPAVKASQGWVRGHIGSMGAYLGAVASGEKFTPSFRDALHVQAVIEAAYRSAANGKCEKIRNFEH
ncbi:MAG: Gfo/Idh/MocA family oxidoreductase [Clostridia bacterium]|nr:Gfo/Idh/MocA family oxidoreductase [Clostridia bacterium]